MLLMCQICNFSCNCNCYSWGSSVDGP